jgi:hypothetical protein
MGHVVIGGLEFLSFLIATIGIRACAKGKILLVMGTDILFATIGFQLTQMIANADTLQERVAYVVGACLGSACGMLLTRRWDRV